MGIALLALLRALPPAVDTVPPGYVAMVNGRGVLQSDFLAQVAEYTNGNYEDATPAQRARVLHDMIDEELLVQRAVTLDLPETTIEVRSVLVAGVNMQVAQPLLGKPASDEALRAFYNAHKDDFTTSGTMTVTDLVLHVGGYENANQNSAQAMADAIEAAYQLRSGADPNYVMDHFGLVNSGRMDGTEQLDNGAKQRLGGKPLRRGAHARGWPGLRTHRRTRWPAPAADAEAHAGTHRGFRQGARQGLQRLSRRPAPAHRCGEPAAAAP